jgi:peptidyl-prolyl cis-trans isomerase SurA
VKLFMKKLFFVLIIAIIPVFLTAQKKVVDRIVAVVDNEIILESELNLQIMQYAAQEKIDPQNPELKKLVLESIIDNQLVLAQAKIDSVIVTDEDVSARIEEKIKQLIQQFGSEERLAQAANMSLNKMRIEFKEEIKKAALIEKERAQKLQNIRVSRREVEDFFQIYKDSLPPVPDEIDLYHIIVYPKPSGDIKSKTYAFAKKIIDSIKSGIDFGVMAARYSEHPSGKNGGDLPWVKRGTFVKEFEEAAFALQIGQVSNAVESPLGVHIIKLVDRKGDGILVKQILLKLKKSESDDKNTIDFLNELKSRISNGERFVELARRYSEDQNTKDMGGYLGKVPISELPENFSAITKKMKAGEISDPAKINIGNAYAYQIIFVEKISPSHKITLETDMVRIENMATRNKQMLEFKKWLAEIRKNIYLDIRI